nr:radical SAM protein [Streptomyces sp. CC224B]
MCEPCNEKCRHCFVSATTRGAYMDWDAVRDRLIPQLLAARVSRVTLTGGEPTMHPGLLPIAASFREAGMSVGVCTNAVVLLDEQITMLAKLEAHLNVSLDGFSADSHGVFRGRPAAFAETVENVKRAAKACCAPQTTLPRTRSTPSSADSPRSRAPRMCC